MTNLLFVCSENRLRSPTAEAVFSNFESIDAIGARTNADVATVVSGEGKRLIVLGIPDDFDYMDPGLVSLLKGRVGRFIGFR